MNQPLPQPVSMTAAIEPQVELDPAAAVPRAAPRQSHAHLIFPALCDTLRSLLSIIVFALFVLTFVVQPFQIPSESMERTLLVGDFLLVNKMIFGPVGRWPHLLPYQPIHRGDIIVFHYPPEPDKHLVKRVIGLPGDHIVIRDARVFVNDQPLAEPYVVFESAFPDPFRDRFPGVLYSDPGVDTHWWIEMHHDLRDGELVVPPDRYFVLGDNRNHSADSRYWGFVPRSNIVGRPFVIYFSLRRPSATDLAAAADDRLGHGGSFASRITDFARWNRMFRIVR
jgi:signal peptidase I